ncbi:MAG: DUF1570 domain-containing protein [Fimbriimonadales bacterium]
MITVAPGVAGAGEAGGDATEAEEIADVQASAKKAGLAPFSITRTKHFLCLGDSPDRFRGGALEICEWLSEAFLSYFRERGFKVALPPRSSTVIALKDDASYRAYYGEDPGEALGHYDPETNRLVIFDSRPNMEGPKAAAQRLNLFKLVHETTHLLCFNTGLLSLTADVPDCISEGLATYAELWQPRGKGKVGGTNRPRLQALFDARKKGERWIPIADLLVDDDLCQSEQTGQLAYAESWALVHYLMTARLAKFQAYLAEVPEADGAAERVKYAEARLGSLKTLDREVNRHAQKLR